MVSRSDNDDDDDNDVFGVYNFDSPAMSTQFNGFYGPLEFNAMQNAFESYNYASDMDTDAIERLCSSAFQECFNVQDDGKHLVVKKADDFGDVCEASSSLCTIEDMNSVTELVDFENNVLLWLPPEPENEEDDRYTSMFGDDDDLDTSGEWGHLGSSSTFGSDEYCEKESSGEEQNKAMKNVVDGHFRALVSQLLQVENIPVTDDNAQESWLEIIIALSWEAATLLKLDTSRSGGMDPGGYVKVKCVASGCRSER